MSINDSKVPNDRPSLGGPYGGLAPRPWWVEVLILVGLFFGLFLFLVIMLLLTGGIHR